MHLSTLRIATRQSPLALWQARSVANRLQDLWPTLDIQLHPFITSGDRFLGDERVNGKALFVKELETALLNHEADIAVHSMKDVPATHPPGLGIPVIIQRDNPYDALVSVDYHSVLTLPYRATVGTSSLRRQAQLLAVRPDLQIKHLRGNIHTRLDKLTSIPLDAIVLAVSGLQRMGLDAHIREIMPVDWMLPACGQGAIGIECRLGDSRIQNLIAPLHHADTALCVHTERQLNALLGGNCHTPVAIFCQKETDLWLQAKVLSPDGCRVIQTMQRGSWRLAADMVEYCATMLLQQGAQSLLDLC